jgi:hypothetical protein
VSLTYDGQDSGPSSADAVMFARAAAAPAELIIDNKDPEFSTTGEWLESYAIDEYAGSSLVGYEKGTTATWRPDLEGGGTFDVHVWYSGKIGSGEPGYYERDAYASYHVTHSGGITIVELDQNVDQGQWVYLGTFDFPGGTAGSVCLGPDSQDADPSVADAVKFSRVIGFPDDVVVDNLDAEFSSTGEWRESYAIDEYAGSSLVGWFAGTSATWTPDLDETGYYDVYAWWSGKIGSGAPGYYQRDSSANYVVESLNGTSVITIDQDDHSGEWVYLASFDFASGTAGSVTLVHDDVDFWPSIADAVKWVLVV